MKILGIETSCDETAAAIVEDGSKILSNVVVSQIDIFASYGGVIPEVAARNHLEAIMPVVHKAFYDAGFVVKNPDFDKKLPDSITNPEYLDDWSKIDAIAVTHTPGLLGSLLIGTLTARSLAIINNKPFYPVHHLKSHIYANWLLSEATPKFPLLALVISGGHTQILYMKSHNHFEIIGTTRDDAVGECFDKVAKILGLPYPGGPSISKAALDGDSHKYKFTHPNVSELDFSFSGLKTQVLRTVQKDCNVPISYPSFELPKLLSKQQVADFSASFQKTAIDILLEKLDKAIAIKNQELSTNGQEIKSIVIAGGVSANLDLRKNASDYFKDYTLSDGSNLQLFFPEPKFSGDNGAMVAAAAYYEIESGVKPQDAYHLDISPRSPLS